jgi:adenosylcobinamide kinase/adenosylcobinamide-phosphate guanylyltransferase
MNEPAGAERGSVILIGGGARSGKSAFALSRALELGQRRAFIATAQAFDGEMGARIAAHVRERGDAFETYEVPHALPEALRELQADVVVIDCLTLWLSNQLLQDRSVDRVLAEVDRLIALLAERHSHVLIVSNEVGMGIVPDNPLGRAFRDLTGHAHQRLAAIADELYFAAMGVILRLRPDPVQALPGRPR